MYKIKPQEKLLFLRLVYIILDTEKIGQSFITFINSVSPPAAGTHG